MLHKTRRWSLVVVEPAELVEKLVNHSWTLCTGFECPPGSNVYWLNDSISPDAPEEYAVVRRRADGSFEQIESITVSWCDAAGLAEYIADFGQPARQGALRSH